MRDFDYIIIGGGCAGLSLAYELQINNKIKNKTLAIIEPREIYEREKRGHFGKSIHTILKIVLLKVGKSFQLIFQVRLIILIVLKHHIRP